MKKLFIKEKPVRFVLISLCAILLVASISVAAAAEIKKRSDPVPDGDAYGSYYDDRKGKALEKVLDVDSQKITVKYVRTENLSEKPISKRSDSYGTYDVYADGNQTEYMYLYNSDLCCGFKMQNVGTATESSKAITQDEALKIANEYLMKNRDHYREYQLISAEYSELAGYYDVQFYLPLNGYKTDDIIRIWVNAQGKITAVSEFNYGRYENLKIDNEKIEKANEKLDKKIASLNRKADRSVEDGYISLNDSGKLVLTKRVVFKTPIGDGDFYTPSVEEFSQRIR